MLTPLPAQHQRHLHEGSGQQSTGFYMTEASDRHVGQCLLLIFEFPWGYVEPASAVEEDCREGKVVSR